MMRGRRDWESKGQRRKEEGEKGRWSIKGRMVKKRDLGRKVGKRQK